MNSTRSRPISIGIVSLGAVALTDPQMGIPVGGAEVQLYLLARALARHEEFVVTLFVADCGQPERMEAGVRLRPLMPLTPTLGLPKTALPRAVWRLARARQGLYITRGASAINGLTLIASRLAGGRHLHMCAHDDEASGRADVTLSRPARWLHHLGLCRADALSCQSEHQRESLRSVFGREALRVDSLPPEIAPQGGDAFRAGLLWVGRDIAFKQPARFLELARALPDIPCTMLCQPQPGRALDRLAIAAPPNLRLVPGLPFHEAAALFGCHRALVSTSAAEGFPNVFLQAAAAGTPVLSLSVDPDGILERTGAGEACGGAMDALIQRARVLLADNTLWARRHEAALRWAQRQRENAWKTLHAAILATLSGGAR